MEHFGLVISCSIGTVFDFVSEDRMNVSYVDVVFILRLYLNFSRNYNGNFWLQFNTPHTISRCRRVVDVDGVASCEYVVDGDVLQVRTWLIAWLLSSFVELSSRGILPCKIASPHDNVIICICR